MWRLDQEDKYKGVDETIQALGDISKKFRIYFI